MPGVVAHMCDPITWEVEAERSKVQGHFCLHSESKASVGLCDVFQNK